MNLASSNEKRPHKLKDDLRSVAQKAILASAEKVFAEQGLRATVETVAKRAGVAVGTLYNYFADREALLVALLEDRSSEIARRLDHALDVAGKKPFAVQLTAYFNAVLEHFDEHRAFLSIVMQCENEQALREKKSTTKRTLRTLSTHAERLVAFGVKSGALDHDDADLHATIVLGLIRGVVHRHLQNQKSGPLAPLAPRLTRFFLAGAGK